MRVENQSLQFGVCRLGFDVSLHSVLLRWMTQKGILIRLDRVSVIYRTAGGNQNALENVELGLDRGESCAVIGPTGCGRSTLLFLLARLLSPTFGRVSVSGVTLTGVRRETSLILQQHGLFP